jgi:hypothetical protein
MGAPRDYAGEGERNDWAMPREDPEEGGCPGSWYRTPFLASVLRYRRRPAEGGQRVPNRHLDTCDDWLVVEAVEAVEAHEDAWRAEWQANLHEKMRAKREAH